MPHQLDRWLYRGGRPNRIAAVLDGIWRRLAARGLAPRRLSALEVRGRRSGRIVAFPVVVADYEDERYLVAMLGEQANWVANVRAARGDAVLRHGRRERVRLDEVGVTDLRDTAVGGKIPRWNPETSRLRRGSCPLR